MSSDQVTLCYHLNKDSPPPPPPIEVLEFWGFKNSKLQMWQWTLSRYCRVLQTKTVRLYWVVCLRFWGAGIQIEAVWLQNPGFGVWAAILFPRTALPGPSHWQQLLWSHLGLCETFDWIRAYHHSLVAGFCTGRCSQGLASPLDCECLKGQEFVPASVLF